MDNPEPITAIVQVTSYGKPGVDFETSNENLPVLPDRTAQPLAHSFASQMVYFAGNLTIENNTMSLTEPSQGKQRVFWQKPVDDIKAVKLLETSMRFEFKDGNIMEVLFTGLNEKSSWIDNFTFSPVAGTRIRLLSKRLNAANRFTDYFKKRGLAVPGYGIGIPKPFLWITLTLVALLLMSCVAMIVVRLASR